MSKNPLGPPLPGIAGGAGVDIVAGVVVRFTASEDNADQIIGAGSVIAVLQCWSNFVVGLGHHLRSGNSLQVVSKSTKRMYVGHGKLLIVTS